MLHYANSIGESDHFETDICIVGAGVAGITFASEFIKSNIRVLLIESGDLKPDDKSTELSKVTNSGLPYYKMEEARAKSFGGSSHLWSVDINEEMEGVRLRALDEIDFEKRDWIPESGWPFSKTEIDPYYEKAHEIFKMGHYSYDPVFWSSSKGNGFLHFKNNTIENTLFQFARKDIFYRHYLDEIRDAENITLLLNATVSNIQLNDSLNSVNQLEVITNEKTVRVESGIVVIAAGGIDNPRLLLLSDKQLPTGIGNRYALVGRYFMEHPHQWNDVGWFYPANAEVYTKEHVYGIHHKQGQALMAYLKIRDEVLREKKLPGFVLGMDRLNKQHFTGKFKTRTALNNIKDVVKRRRAAQRLPSYAMEFIQHGCRYVSSRVKMQLSNRKKQEPMTEFTGIQINYMAEQIPNPNSRVTLSRNKDSLGLRMADLHWKVTPKDLQGFEQSLKIIDRALRDEGLGYQDIEYDTGIAGKEIKGGYHHMGTTRMNNDPRKGVVNENCKVHGIHNLYIAGSSVFPTSGYANPTLTIAALTVRLSDHIKNEIANTRKLSI